jgi:hypothetical protein
MQKQRGACSHVKPGRAEAVAYLPRLRTAPATDKRGIMSIAAELEKDTALLRELHRRNNGDLEAALPDILESMDAQIARVRGLENMDFLTTDLLKDFQHNYREAI